MYEEKVASKLEWKVIKIEFERAVIGIPKIRTSGMMNDHDTHGPRCLKFYPKGDRPPQHDFIIARINGHKANELGEVERVTYGR